MLCMPAKGIEGISSQSSVMLVGTAMTMLSLVPIGTIMLPKMMLVTSHSLLSSAISLLELTHALFLHTVST